ncbi:MAG: hypothetical protein KA797_09395 [Chitinophagales bacterium]|nr:hypothetical protein [Chitinophagales bacterium]
MKYRRLYDGIVLFMAIVLLMYYGQMPLTNEDVVAMELAFDEVNLQGIQSRIGQDAWGMFGTHVVYDFLLMLSYVYLIIQFLFFIKYKHELYSVKNLILLICFAGALDGIEDILMYQRITLNNLSIRPEMWSYISCAKFIFIATCIVYILRYLLMRKKEKVY